MHGFHDSCMIIIDLIVSYNANLFVSALAPVNLHLFDSQFDSNFLFGSITVSKAVKCSMFHG